MNDIIKTLKEMGKENLQFIFLNLLHSKSIDFQELTEMYILYLKEKEEEKHKIIVNLAVPSSFSFEQIKGVDKEHTDFLKFRIAKGLIDSNMYKGTKFEKELLKFVEKHKEIKILI